MNEPVAWKAYEEVHFSNKYILRWVREGDEYVNRMTKETMEEFKFLVEKELTDEDKSMLIRTLKWSEDLLRVAGHDEAVSDVQDCLMILRKAQE